MQDMCCWCGNCCDQPVAIIAAVFWFTSVRHLRPSTCMEARRAPFGLRFRVHGLGFRGLGLGFMGFRYDKTDTVKLHPAAFHAETVVRTALTSIGILLGHCRTTNTILRVPYHNNHLLIVDATAKPSSEDQFNENPVPLLRTPSTLNPKPGDQQPSG